MHGIKHWVFEHGLQISSAKFVVSFITRHILQTAEGVFLSGTSIPINSVKTYLGVVLDNKLN